MPDLIGYPAFIWIPAFAGMTTFGYFIAEIINDITEPFVHKLSSKYIGLTPAEIQTACLLKDGKTTNEVEELLSVSPLEVESRRKNIRMKLGIKNKKANLRSHLLSI